MVIISGKEYVKPIGRLNCGRDKATAFLISNDLAITATHAVEKFYSDKIEIKLEFMNIYQEPIIRKALPIENIPPSPITILKLEKCIDIDFYHSFCEKEINKDDEYEIFGYPAVKWGVGAWIKSTVIRRIKDGMTQTYDWDIDLNHESNIENFSGLSGSPLFVNSKLVGVVLSENDSNGKAISLGAISVKKIIPSLNAANIKVEKFVDYDKYEVYELAEDQDYSNSMFIAMLESANIFDHEDCQQEFFNAEIAKSAIESKVVDSEIKHFVALKANVRSVWKTQHRLYDDENDGNILLSNVYGRIEDLSESTLKGDGNFSLIVKKGLLHQLADESKLGWVKKYDNKVKEYLERVGKDD